MNMSLPGRVSCSMLNCFVSAAFYSPSLLRGSGAVSQLRSPAHMPLEASSGSARGEGGSPSHTPPEDAVARPCCPGWAQGHGSARRRGLSPGRPWAPCWALPALLPACSWEITVLEQPSPGSPCPLPGCGCAGPLRCCAVLCCAEMGACTRCLLYLQREGVSCSDPSCRQTHPQPLRTILARWALRASGGL